MRAKPSPPPGVARMAEGNMLYFGGNLRFLQDQSIFPSEAVDLVYLDPLSSRSGNV